MALAEKYYYEFMEPSRGIYAAHPVPGDRTVRVELHEEGFAGLVTEISHANTDMNFLADSSKEKDVTIMATELDVNLAVNQSGVFDELTFDEREMQARVHIDTVEVWRGWVSTSLGVRPYYNLPYNQNIKAFDGLASLKGIDYPPDGSQSALDIIHYCLDQTGLGLSYHIGMNTFEDAMNTSLEPFGQIDIISEVFSETDSNMSCYDVLVQVLGRFECRVMQWNGMWDIDRWDDVRNTARIKRVINTSLTEDSQSTAWVVNTVGHPDLASFPLRWIENSQKMRWFPGWKEAGIITQYGAAAPKIENGGFESWASTTDVDEWNEAGSGATVNQDTDAIEGLYSARIESPPAGGATPSKHLESITAFTTGLPFDVSFQYKIHNTENDVGNKMRFQIQVGVNYLQDLADTWSTTNTIIEVDTDILDNWLTLSLVGIDPPASGSVVIRLYAGTNPGNTVSEYDTFYDNVLVNQPDAILYESKREFIKNITGNNYTFKPEDREFIIGDIFNAAVMGQMKISGTPTADWSVTGGSKTLSISRLNLDRLMNNNHEPLPWLDGDILGRVDPTQQLFENTLINNPRFIFMGGGWHMDRGMWSTEWAPIPSDDIVFGTGGSLKLKE